MTLLLRATRWSQLSSFAAVEVDRVEGIVRRGQQRRRAHGCPLEGYELGNDVGVELVAELGPAVAGWDATLGDGGPVHVGDTWNLADDDRLPGAVRECVEVWLAWLGRLEAVFAAVPRHADVKREVAVAAPRILELVLEVTTAEDAWYQTMIDSLRWFLESRGHEGRGYLIQRAVRGPFESWIEPSDQVAGAAFAALAASLGEPPEDALAAWRSGRTAHAYPGGQAPGPVTGDGHRQYVDAHDRPRSAERAERMHVALDAARAVAAPGRPLTLSLLAEWQSIILGREAKLRTRAARAHGERYGRPPAGFAELDRLWQVADEPPLHQAALRYLDVCFFHPFEDGNARAARLALDFTLHGAGLALHRAEPLFMLWRSGHDPSVGTMFRWCLERLAGRR